MTALGVITPILDAEGRVVYILHRVEDVTDVLGDTQRARLAEAQTRALESRQLEMQAELYQRAQELQATNRQLRKLRELALRMLGVLDASDIFRIATSALLDADLGVQFAVAYLVDVGPTEQAQAKQCATAGRPPNGQPLPELVVLDDSGDETWPLATAYRSGAAQLRQMRARLVAEHVTMQSQSHIVWVLPLREGQVSPAGLLVIGASTGHADDQSYTSFLELVAHQVSAALAQVDAHERDQQRAASLAVARDRERIAMDLHDGVIQALYGVALELAAEQTGPPAIAEDQRLLFVRLRSQLNDAIRDLRAYIMRADATSALVEGSAFGDSIRAIVNEARQGDWACRADVRLPTDVVSEAEARLQPSATAALLQIAREAVSNARRHAGAKSLMLRLEKRDGQLILAIQDDGRGFDPDIATATGSGRGLRNMARRASGIGGRLQIASHPGDGAQIIVEVPLPPSVPETRTA